MLITSSNLDACSTGRSPGWAPRSGLLEELEPLAGSLWAGAVSHTSHVSTGAREAGHEFVLNRVRTARHDDRDRRRRLLGGLNGRRPDRHDDVYTSANQILRQTGELIHLGIRKPALDDEVPAFYVAKLLEGVSKWTGHATGSGARI